MSDFASEVRRLKRGAIDAWMSQEGYTVTDDEYIRPAGPFLTGVPPRHWLISRPGEDGEGGGDLRLLEGGHVYDYSGSGDNPGAHFDTIRSHIEGIVSRWRTIPKPSAFTDDAARFAELTGLLSGTAPAGSTAGAGTAIASLNAAAADMEQLQGVAFAAFEERFIVHLSAILGNLAGLSLAVVTSLEVEAELWRRARADSIEAVRLAANAMEQVVATRSAASAELSLSVVGAIGAAAATIGAGASTGPGVAVVAVAAGVVLVTSLVSSISDFFATIEGVTYEAVAETLVDGLNTLSDAIGENEQAIVDAAQQTITAISDHGDRFNLANVDIPERPDAGFIEVNDAAASEVMTHFSEALDALQRLRPYLAQAPNRAAGTRSGIGIGATGPTAAVVALHMAMSATFASTIMTMDAGLRGFEAVLDAFARLDDDNGAIAQGLIAYLETLS